MLAGSNKKPPSTAMTTTTTTTSRNSPRQALALRRMPIVVIPRKRKYKNYVSRRRNTQLLASLRRCVSDPHVYRSFNHWKLLSRPFSPVALAPASPQTQSPMLDKSNKEATAKEPTTTSLLSPHVDKTRTPQSLSESNSKANSSENGTSETTPATVPVSSLPAPPMTKNISGKLTELKKQNSVKSISRKNSKNDVEPPKAPITAKPPTSILPKSIDSRRNSTKSVNTVAPLPDSKPPVTPPEPVKKSDGIEFIIGQPDRQEEKPLASVKPQVQNPKAVRKTYGSKSGTTICAVGSPIGIPSTSNGISPQQPPEDDKRLIEKKLSLRRKKNEVTKDAGVALLTISKSGVDLSKDHTDEQKAKKTVNQVAAAFSNQVPAPPDEAKEQPVKTCVPPKPKPSTNNLLAQLQLPASVSAKVDKIIASGTKAKRTGAQIRVVNQSRPKPSEAKKTQASATSAVQDNKEGHLIYTNGDAIGDYMIVNTLGEGTFGKVVKVIRKSERKPHNEKALKIIKALPKYRDAAKMEIKVLQRLKEKDPGDEYYIIHLRDWFDFHGHFCLVFDLLALSVYDYLKSNGFRPYPMHQICHIAFQVCTALDFLHKNRLAHTDLKPENIMFLSCETVLSNTERNLKQLVHTDIRLIDFGSATFHNEHHTAIISTRHYRAPEVILELGWNESCDVWSMGCVLFELYTGYTLFQTHENREHLAMMDRVVGSIPMRMCKITKVKYFQNNKLDWTPNSEDAQYVRENCRPLRRSMVSNDPEHVELFELIELMLSYEPCARLTMQEALEHRYFRRLKTSEKTPKPIRKPL